MERDGGAALSATGALTGGIWRIPGAGSRVIPEMPHNLLISGQTPWRHRRCPGISGLNGAGKHEITGEHQKTQVD